jgi:hypothetical protein
MQGYLSIITVAELAAGQMRQADEEAKVQHFSPIEALQVEKPYD